MLPPDQDETDRRPIWDALQMFCMDTDPGLSVQTSAAACARSKYSVAELEQIFWNEVRPAVQFNLRSIAGEWAGFEIEWLSRRILATNRFGCALPAQWLDPESRKWWNKLRGEVERIRAANGG
jgi:hypothetical protein